MTTLERASAVDIEELVGEAVGDGFVRAVLAGRRRTQAPPWKRVTVRPVSLRGERRLQFVYLDERKSVTENLSPEGGRRQLQELARAGFSNIVLETRTESVQVRFTKRDKVTVHRARAHRPPPALDHDRDKQRVLPADARDPYLRAVGITTPDGRVRADRYAKYRQINEFLRIVSDAGRFDDSPPAGPLHVVDLGCGNAYLTFAAFHYLNNVVGVETALTGVDSRADSVARNRDRARALGWAELRFERADILAFEPERAPDIVLALHACDTATDDALARAVHWKAGLVFSSPCCHQHLHAQLGTRTPAGFEEVMRHGILRQRIGDALTDAFRASILGLLGYRASVVQFVSPEHTDKNLMIRAVRVDRPPRPARVDAYRALKSAWGVTPYLEELLGDELAPILDA